MFAMAPMFRGTSGPVTDPYFSSVKTLLHFNGANLSTTITDSEGTPKTFTANSGAKISTALSQYGGSSLLLNGTSDYVSTPDSADFAFGAGDFTVEAWVRPSAAVSSLQIICGQWGSTDLGWNLALSSGNSLVLETSTTGLYQVPRDLVSAGGVAPTGSFTHVAMTRLGNLYTLWAGGVSVGTLTITGTLFDSSLAMTIGASAVSGNFFAGNIDDLRITKGVARYTTTFTPPPQQFPDS